MIDALIVLAAGAAAAYLLYPLTRRRGRRLLVLIVLLLSAQTAAKAAVTQPSVGLLLIAVDAQRDYLRISEALRMVNGGPPREMDLLFPLPAGAVYLTAHRGVRTPALEAGGFRARLTIPRGVSEIAYSYALPAASTRMLERTFPLPVQRLEMIVRGRGVMLAASRGGAVEPLQVGGESLSRWEVRAVAAGEPIAFSLRGLPISRRWFPPAAAGALAAVLLGGLAAAAKARPPADAEKVEESPPVRRN